MNDGVVDVLEVVLCKVLNVVVVVLCFEGGWLCEGMLVVDIICWYYLCMYVECICVLVCMIVFLVGVDCVVVLGVCIGFYCLCVVGVDYD